ncbi:MAG TPA: amylo-alpha-1,6-glucosidase [Rhizomicrobium sp.]|nr:amylo-alpha-1,6-glucosidase [Rhizomicrobium sp.]
MEAKTLPDLPEDISSFYIQATESIQQRWPRTLKQGDTFGLFDALGDCVAPGLTPGGLFHNDTRYLSGVQLLIDGQRPLLLSSAVENDNVILTVDLSNPDIYQGNAIVLPREILHIRRSKFLWQGSCHERIAVRNFDTKPQKCWLTINFAADFADLFEIRGMQRAKRGELTCAVVGNNKTIFRYVGLDRIERRSEICLDPPPRQLFKSQALYALELGPNEQFALVMTVRCTDSVSPREAVTDVFSEPYRAARRGASRAASLGGSATSSNELANRMLARAGADLSMLVSDTPQGPYPYAGTPWFSTPFGRDGLITALQILWLDPGLARGVLRYLAHHQATMLDPRSDAEPGKILHETRASEMANLGEVPFGHYYGSIDSTPLFVLLAARYFERSGDIETIRQLWPHIEAALSWIDTYGDRDGDGFVEYYRMSADGLTNQGWKDSADSIMHADGSLATGPIALCEVQAYVYAAKQGASALAAALGRHEQAASLAAAAEKLRTDFEAKFWIENLGAYALALDGEKRPCQVLSSNAGQVLVCGIAAPERARILATTLLTPEMFSGWGIRTLSADAPRFNPMSYHNGSVWPHDNALIALGLARYGLKRGASAIFEGLFEAAGHMDMMRFPELFCGFPRRRGVAPVLYPVACSPQAWASVVPFALLQASLGLELNYANREISFHNPQLPRFLEEVRINDLELAEATVNLRLRRRGSHTEVAIVSQRGDIGIKITQ